MENPIIRMLICKALEKAHDQDNLQMVADSDIVLRVLSELDGLARQVYHELHEMRMDGVLVSDRANPGQDHSGLSRIATHIQPNVTLTAND